MTNEMRFEEIMERVGEGLRWYEVYESELFEEVKRQIAVEFGKPAEEVQGFKEWEAEMAEEL